MKERTCSSRPNREGTLRKLLFRDVSTLREERKERLGQVARESFDFLTWMRPKPRLALKYGKGKATREGSSVYHELSLESYNHKENTLRFDLLRLWP
ncbi:hypothetical protein U1Q18_035362 [Sarracenia purpurea var. burkii]